MAHGITRPELKSRLGFFVFSIGAFYVAVAIREPLGKVVPIPSWLLGVIIMLIALYFFKL